MANTLVNFHGGDPNSTNNTKSTRFSSSTTGGKRQTDESGMFGGRMGLGTTSTGSRPTMMGKGGFTGLTSMAELNKTALSTGRHSGPLTLEQQQKKVQDEQEAKHLDRMWSPGNTFASGGFYPAHSRYEFFNLFVVCWRGTLRGGSVFHFAASLTWGCAGI